MPMRGSYVLVATLLIALAVILGVSLTADDEPVNGVAQDRVGQLIEQLGSNHFPEREKAAKELISIGAPALEPLRQALKHDDPEVARRARDCIAAIERNEPVQTLAADLNNTDPDVRMQAAKDLARMGPGLLPVFPALIDALGDPNVQVQEAVIAALVAAGSEGNALLVNAAKDKRDVVRAGVARAMGTVVPPAWRKPFLASLLHAAKDESLRVRQAAVRSLAAYQEDGETVLPALAKALKDAEPQVRAAAAGALAAFGPKADPVAPELFTALTEDQAPDVRSNAGAALKRGGPASVAQLTRLLRDGQEANRILAIELLGEHRLREKDRTIPAALVETVRDESVEVRRVAVRALRGFRGERTAAAGLFEALNDPDAVVRVGAACGLAYSNQGSSVTVPV